MLLMSSLSVRLHLHPEGVCVCMGLTAYLLIKFTPTEGQSDDSVVRQLLSCYLK